MHKVKLTGQVQSCDFDIKHNRKTLAIEVPSRFSTVPVSAPESQRLPEIKEKVIKTGRWIG